MPYFSQSQCQDSRELCISGFKNNSKFKWSVIVVQIYWPIGLCLQYNCRTRPFIEIIPITATEGLFQLNLVLVCLQSIKTPFEIVEQGNAVYLLEKKICKLKLNALAMVQGILLSYSFNFNLVVAFQ